MAGLGSLKKEGKPVDMSSYVIAADMSRSPSEIGFNLKGGECETSQTRNTVMLVLKVGCWLASQSRTLRWMFREYGKVVLFSQIAVIRHDGFS